MDYSSAASPKTQQEQIDITIQDQEKGLDDIHAGAIRLKHHATAINHEVKDQNTMLDDLDTNIDRTHQEVQTQAQAAQAVHARKKKLCCLYGVIALLILVLILVLSL